MGNDADRDPEFRLGDLLPLPARDGESGAVVALYSVIAAYDRAQRPASSSTTGANCSMKLPFTMMYEQPKVSLRRCSSSAIS